MDDCCFYLILTCTMPLKSIYDNFLGAEYYNANAGRHSLVILLFPEMAGNHRPMTRTELIMQNSANIIKERRYNEEQSGLRRSIRKKTINKQLANSDFLPLHTSTPRHRKEVYLVALSGMTCI